METKPFRLSLSDLRMTQRPDSVPTLYMYVSNFGVMFSGLKFSHILMTFMCMQLLYILYGSPHNIVHSSSYQAEVDTAVSNGSVSLLD